MKLFWSRLFCLTFDNQVNILVRHQSTQVFCSFLMYSVGFVYQGFGHFTMPYELLIGHLIIIFIFVYLVAMSPLSSHLSFVKTDKVLLAL